MSAFCREWHRADIEWDLGSHLWPHWVVLRVINRNPLAYLHVKLVRDWGQLSALFSPHCPLWRFSVLQNINATRWMWSLSTSYLAHTLLRYYTSSTASTVPCDSSARSSQVTGSRHNTPHTADIILKIKQNKTLLTSCFKYLWSHFQVINCAL